MGELHAHLGRRKIMKKRQQPLMAQELVTRARERRPNINMRSMPTLIRRYLGISGASLPGITSMSTSVVAHVSGYMFLDKCEQLGLTKINRRGVRQLDGKKAIAWAKKYEEGLLA